MQTHLLTNKRRNYTALLIGVLLFMICNNPSQPTDFQITWTPYYQYGDSAVNKLRLDITSPSFSTVIDSLSVQDSIGTFSLLEGEKYTLCFYAIKFDSIFSECATIYLNLIRPVPPRGIVVKSM